MSEPTGRRVHDQGGSVTDLDALADELLDAARQARAQRAARTLVAVGSLRSTVIALTGGASLADHENPGAATLHVLRGEVVLHAGDQEWRLPAGSLVQIPDERHGLHTDDDAVVLLTVALGAEKPPLVG